MTTKQKNSQKQYNQLGQKQYVWYVSYGSNLSRKRFEYYIQGGTMPENGVTYRGCRDKTLPRNVKKLTLQHELYFAQTSKVWGGGVAFIDEHQSASASTCSYAYLITLEQFADVVRQENNLQSNLRFSLADIVEQGKLTIRQLDMYSEVLYLGNIDDVPSVTFTAQSRAKSAKPTKAYLRQIAQGLRQDYKMTSREISSYLGSKSGIKGYYTTKELIEL